MTTNVTNKIFTAAMGGTSATAYIGNTGEIFYDVDGTTPLRLSDGTTPGGKPFGVATGSRSFNAIFTNTSGQTLTGTVTTASYVKQGVIVHFRVNVDFTNTTFFGNSSSGYVITLPFPAAHTVTIRGGTLHNEGTDSRYHIAGITDIQDAIPDAATSMKLYYSGSTTDLPWRNVTPVSATTTTSHFDISGAYETSSTAV
jgi:hypothetical protein